MNKENEITIQKKIPFYHLNAFTDQLFGGNPAGVCVLSEWLAEDTLHAIAKENNLPATAFLVKDQSANRYFIRWITPEYELDLCGHGTLSAGYVIFHFLQPSFEQIELQSKLELLHVYRQRNLVTLDFPVKTLEESDVNISILERAFGLKPVEIYQHKQERILAIYENEETIKQIKPDMEVLKQLKHRGISITAKGNAVDFVSRTFYPQKSISEDPATGASHCLLAPYWALRLNKIEFQAKQLSARGGEMYCQLKQDRVLISGNVVIYSQGDIII